MTNYEWITLKFRAVSEGPQDNLNLKYFFSSQSKDLLAKIRQKWKGMRSKEKGFCTPLSNDLVMKVIYSTDTGRQKKTMV